MNVTTTATSLPAVRACIFDMDGLLIKTEDLITLSINQLLEKYGRPIFTRPIRSQLMGVPDSTNSDVFHDWAKLPISRDQFARESTQHMAHHFPNCKPLSGAEALLSNLSRACGTSSGYKIELATASSNTPGCACEGRTGMSGIGDDWQLGEIDDGWAETISSLRHFDYEKYGITVPSEVS